MNRIKLSCGLVVFFSVIFFSAVLGCSAQAQSSGAANSDRAKSGSASSSSFTCTAAAMPAEQGRAILEKVQTQYALIETMQGSFNQDSYVAALDEGEVSSGSMIFAKPGKMRWSYKTPREQEVVIRDGELWMYQPDKGQVMIDSVGSVLLSALPVSFLMGIGNVTKDFDLVSACKTWAGVAVSLVPHKQGGSKDREEALEGFTLLVDPLKNVPKGAKIVSVGGNTTAIVFENLQLNVPGISSGRFVLEYPKGVDILDRRSVPGQ
jgi:outer membrane lipoprotein carrier protein